jgi:hypothetical protein
MNNKNINSAIEWVHQNIDLFNPLNDINDKYTIKMFSELQLALLVIEREQEYLNEDSIKNVNKIISLSEQIILDPRYYEQVQLHPEAFRMYGASIIYYLSYRKNKILESIIQKTYEIAYDITPEILPYRKMDYEHCLSLADLYIVRPKQHFMSMAKLAENSVLNSSLDLLHFTILEEYSLTHAIFYLSDLGNKYVSIDICKKVENSISVLAMKNILNNDLDLLGEYIMSLCCIHSKLYTTLDYLLQQFLLCQSSEGSFLGPERNGKKIPNENNLDEPTKRKNQVRYNYHTTLVAIMALTLYNKEIAIRRHEGDIK